MVQKRFVARERELEQLDGFLQRAQAAQGAVCFVTGEAGSGKTALITEFARRAQEAHENLVVAVGQSDAQTGTGDPYLPFREVLGQLTGDVEAKLAQGAITDENASRLRKLLAFSGRALVEVGPDLIELFVPWVGLATRAASFAADKAGWLDRMEQLVTKSRGRPEIGQAGIEQEHIFEQYTNVLNQLAEKQPLLVVLDDLQWADDASIGLLFRLGRRIGGSRILIVGTYRPEEVALGRPSTSSGQVERHPLEKVLAEFKRYHGDLAVDLDAAKEAEGRGFVDAFLDTESNRLGDGFRSALFQHTDGHPLFTIELLRDMQERGDLVRDERGRWVEGPVLDWTDLPDRAEGVIEERIGRLEGELRETLTVGSVEGEQFTAEVVARVQAIEVRGLIRRLSQELERQHRLVASRGMERVNGQRLSLYRFQHNLFQAYLYSNLDEVERICLHEDVGKALESLYGMQADQVAVSLARHFVEAGIGDKAARYLRLAGEQAAARYANAQAVDYFGRALEFTSEKELTERYALLLAREKIYDVQGEREAQAQDLVALGELAELLDDDRRRAEVALRQARYAEVSGDYPAAIAAAQAAIRLARMAQDPNGEAAGHRLWGITLMRQGDYKAAGAQFAQTLTLARSARLPKMEADSLRNLGTLSYYQGDYAQSKTYSESSLGICREIGDRQGESGTLINLGIACWCLGDYAGAGAYLAQTLDIYREVGNRWGQGMALHNLGIVSHRLGDYARAGAFYEQALDINRDIGQRQGEAHGLSYQGLLSYHLGDYVAAREYSQQALLIAQNLGHRDTQGLALTFLGHACAELGFLAEATDAYHQALTLRQETDQPNLAMEPLAGLARVCLAQGDLTQAQAHAEEILSYLESHGLDDTEEPFRVYLTCYRILDANQDPRAQETLNTAYNLLHEQASSIADEDTRRLFLENIPAHREILSEFAKGQRTGKGER